MTDPEERAINRAICELGDEHQDVRDEARAALHTIFRRVRKLEAKLSDPVGYSNEMYERRIAELEAQVTGLIETGTGPIYRALTIDKQKALTQRDEAYRRIRELEANAKSPNTTAFLKNRIAELEADFAESQATVENAWANIRTLGSIVEYRTMERDALKAELDDVIEQEFG